MYDVGRGGEVLEHDVIDIFLDEGFLEEGEAIERLHVVEQRNLDVNIVSGNGVEVDLDGPDVLIVARMLGLSQGGHTL